MKNEIMVQSCCYGHIPECFWFPFPDQSPEGPAEAGGSPRQMALLSKLPSPEAAVARRCKPYPSRFQIGCARGSYRWRLEVERKTEGFVSCPQIFPSSRRSSEHQNSSLVGCQSVWGGGWGWGYHWELR
jgi:hypothetical protein